METDLEVCFVLGGGSRIPVKLNFDLSSSRVDSSGTIRFIHRPLGLGYYEGFYLSISNPSDVTKTIQVRWGETLVFQESLEPHMTTLVRPTHVPKGFFMLLPATEDDPPYLDSDEPSIEIHDDTSNQSYKIPIRHAGAWRDAAPAIDMVDAKDLEI